MTILSLSKFLNLSLEVNSMQNLKNDSLSYAIDLLEENKDCLIGSYLDELHYFLFNQDYFIIGNWKAQQWLGDNLFKVIEHIKEYELNYFDFMEDSTDFSSPESIANMAHYIFGEEILQESRIFNCLGGRLYQKLNEFTIDLIIRELRLKLIND